MDYDNSTHENSSVNSKAFIFDVKAFAFKFLSYWKLIILSLGIALGIAYSVNVRKQNYYRLDSLMMVENDNNPFFTSNTSISFNWGGTSDKVGKVITTLTTRSHNEAVIDSLEFYKEYLKQGDYRLEDIYTTAPFDFTIDKQKGQLLNIPIGIRFLDSNNFELFLNFDSERVSVQNYDTKKRESVAVSKGEFKRVFKIGEEISLPFLSGKFSLTSNRELQGKEFFLRFRNFDVVVAGYRRKITVEPISKNNTSVLRLSLVGFNKMRIVDYLNATVGVLSKNQLERKNLYATNTIRFIDSTLTLVNQGLSEAIVEMNNFKKKNKTFNVNDEITQISIKLREYDNLKENERNKINYLDNLKTYLKTKTDYTNIAAPTSVGINESNIASSVTSITALAIERQNLEYTTKEGNILFKDLDRRIDAEKNVLLETIDATRNSFNLRLNTINSDIAKFETQLSKLPEEQQQYLSIQRKLSISQETYDVYMAKRSEAAIVRAANVSDITIIDEAKDIGGGLIGPNTSLNYMMALLLGLTLPFFVVFLLFILDNTIRNVGDVTQLSDIPILGVVGKHKHSNNLVVYEDSMTPIAESFRAIRSNLQYMYKKQPKNGGKTLMVTSSISGEGKTFCSTNIATVYALTGKKTILLGLDLRKPKMYDDFKVSNDKGIVNYLIGEERFEDIVTKTHVNNLDIISSGPVPPNPSELLMSGALDNLIEKARMEYDIVILDTPPLGLVTDAFELSQYADASIYMVRLDYTKKGMLQLINSKHINGEIKNLSFLINFYRPKNKADYNYGYGYGYGYGVYGDKYRNSKKRSLKNIITNFFSKNNLS